MPVADSAVGRGRRGGWAVLCSDDSLLGRGPGAQGPAAGGAESRPTSAACVRVYSPFLGLLRGVGLTRAFSNSVPQEFFKHAIPDYLVRGMDLFSLTLSNKKVTAANTTTAISVNESKLYLLLLSNRQKIYFLVCCRVLVISLCVPEMKKVENHWPKSHMLSPERSIQGRQERGEI